MPGFKPLEHVVGNMFWTSIQALLLPQPETISSQPYIADILRLASSSFGPSVESPPAPEIIPGQEQLSSPKGPCTQYLGTWDLGNSNFDTGFE